MTGRWDAFYSQCKFLTSVKVPVWITKVSIMKLLPPPHPQKTTTPSYIFFLNGYSHTPHAHITLTEAPRHFWCVHYAGSALDTKYFLRKKPLLFSVFYLHLLGGFKMRCFNSATLWYWAISTLCSQHSFLLQSLVLWNFVLTLLLLLPLFFRLIFKSHSLSLVLLRIIISFYKIDHFFKRTSKIVLL